MPRFLALILLLAPATAVATSLPTPPPIDARAWTLIDFDSGLTLTAKDADLPVEPASTTKIMTALLVADALSAGTLRLDERVHISQRAWRAEGSRTFLDVGSKVAVEDLLSGMIVQSGNDAAIALAERIAGSEAAFAVRMTARARALGATATTFRNATGLPDPGHLSSAHDLALISMALMREYPAMYARFQQREFTWNRIRQRNRNSLLRLDPSADGVKTGYTEAAGFTVVGSALRDGRRLVAVTLGSRSDRARDRAVRSLIDWGFRHWEVHRLYAAAQPLGEVKVWKGASERVAVGTAEDVWVAVPRGRYAELKAYMEFAPRLIAPVTARAALGQLKVMLGDQALAELPVLALDGVAEGDTLRRLVDTARLLIE